MGRFLKNVTCKQGLTLPKIVYNDLNPSDKSVVYLLVLLCCFSTLPPQFPQDKPHVKVVPPVRHPWVNDQMIVTGSPGLNSVRRIIITRKPSSRMRTARLPSIWASAAARCQYRFLGGAELWGSMNKVSRDGHQISLVGGSTCLV